MHSNQDSIEVHNAHAPWNRRRNNINSHENKRGMVAHDRREVIENEMKSKRQIFGRKDKHVFFYNHGMEATDTVPLQIDNRHQAIYEITNLQSQSNGGTKSKITDLKEGVRSAVRDEGGAGASYKMHTSSRKSHVDTTHAIKRTDYSVDNDNVLYRKDWTCDTQWRSKHNHAALADKSDKNDKNSNSTITKMKSQQYQSRDKSNTRSTFDIVAQRMLEGITTTTNTNTTEEEVISINDAQTTDQSESMEFDKSMNSMNTIKRTYDENTEDYTTGNAYDDKTDAYDDNEEYEKEMSNELYITAIADLSINDELYVTAIEDTVIEDISNGDDAISVTDVSNNQE